MNVFLRLNTNVLNYFLIYVRMLIRPNLSFESESYDSHVVVRVTGHWSEGALVRRVTGPKVMV